MAETMSRAVLALALIADMAGDGSSTMKSIRDLALREMRLLRPGTKAGTPDAAAAPLIGGNA